MTLLTSDAKIQYNGDGVQTVFPIAFPFFDATHIQAVRREASGVETVLTQGSDYTVSGGGGGTGTLTATAAPESGVTLTIRRVVPLTQDTDYPEGGAFPASSHENALDRLTMMTQQLDEAGGRALKFPVTDIESLSGEMPSSVERAGRILGFDTSGNPASSAATLASIEAAVAGVQANGTGFRDYQFFGDAAATAFVMTGVEVVTKLQCLVSIDGLMQSVANFSTAIAGGNTTLTFTTAPPNGAEINVLVAAIDVATLESTVAPTTLGTSLVQAATATAMRTLLGFTAFGDSLATAADAAAAQALLQGWATGDVKLTLATAAPPGWVPMDDGTIGNATSGASNRANADTEDLFTLIHDSIADAWAPVSGGRTTAAADFAANKTIALPKALGRSLALAGAGAGLTVRALGETLGEETHTLTPAESAALTYSVNVNNAAGGQVNPSTRYHGNDGVTGQYSGTATANIMASDAVVDNAGDGPHNNMQPSSFLNAMVKL